MDEFYIDRTLSSIDCISYPAMGLALLKNDVFKQESERLKRPILISKCVVVLSSRNLFASRT